MVLSVCVACGWKCSRPTRSGDQQVDEAAEDRVQHAEVGKHELNQVPPRTTIDREFEAREAPIDVTITDGLAADLGEGWTEQIQDTFGEFQLRTWLTESGVPPRRQRPRPRAGAATGWRS